MYLLRATPAFADPNIEVFDSALREVVEELVNCHLGDEVWEWATLPVAKGGLGIRRASSIALPAFLSSVNSVAALSNKIFENIRPDSAFLSALLVWDTKHATRPPDDQLGIQKEWDSIESSDCHVRLSSRLPGDDATKARFLSSQSDLSKAWLHVLPSVPLGLRLTDEEVRVVIALRFGLKVTEVHFCSCGAQADETGVHALSCSRSGGRHSRHAAANQVILRAFQAAKVPAVLEPIGLCDNSGKRPDGLYLIPWSRGKPVVWDFTCRHTVATSNVSGSSKTIGFAASEAYTNKLKKYAALQDRYHVIPVSCETHGAISQESLLFYGSWALAYQKQRVNHAHLLFFCKNFHWRYSAVMPSA